MKDLILSFLNKITEPRLWEPVNPDSDGPTTKVVHQDEKLIDLERYLVQPRRIKTERNFKNLDSFIAYINYFIAERFGPDAPFEPHNIMFGRPAIFIDCDESSVSCDGHIDFHNSIDSASHATHQVSLFTHKTNDFSSWTQLDNEWMPQDDFCDKLKKHAHSFEANELNRLLSAVADVNGTSSYTNTNQNTSKGKSKSQYFSVLENFVFTFRPIVSLPYTFEINATLATKYDERSETFYFKYTMESPYLIFQKVAEKLRIDLDASCPGLTII